MRRYKSCAVFFFFLLFMLIIQERKGGLFIYARRPDYWLVAALNEGISGATGVLLTGVLVFSWGFIAFSMVVYLSDIPTPLAFWKRNDRGMGLVCVLSRTVFEMRWSRRIAATLITRMLDDGGLSK